METIVARNIRILREEYEKKEGEQLRDIKYNEIKSTKDGWIENERGENKVKEGRKEISTATASINSNSSKQNVSKVLNNKKVNKQKQQEQDTNIRSKNMNRSKILGKKEKKEKPRLKHREKTWCKNREAR